MTLTLAGWLGGWLAGWLVQFKRRLHLYGEWRGVLYPPVCCAACVRHYQTEKFSAGGEAMCAVYPAQ